jgi:hypothetical protein
MTTRLAAVLFAAFAACCARAQAPTPPATDALLDRLAGRWVLEGTIAGRPTTHDVDADWVLARQYLRLHEISREKTEAGRPRYEAIVFIAVDRASGAYTCLWLDSTTGDGLAVDALGHATRRGDTIAFAFRDQSGAVTFTNTFGYERGADAWTWDMDNVKGGAATPFARVRLTRRR